MAASSSAPEGSAPASVTFMQHPCLWTTVKGTAVGAVVGAGFHMVAGPSAMVIGQPNLRMQMILTQAAKAAGRIAGVFAVYSGVRCFAARELGIPSSAPLLGGAVAVAIPFALNPNRVAFFQAYAKENLRGMAMNRALTVSSAAVSGAVVFGLMDVVLSVTGLNWCD